MKRPSDYAGNKGGEYNTSGCLVCTKKCGPMTQGIDRFNRLSVRNQGCEYDERDQSGINRGRKDTVATRR